MYYLNNVEEILREKVAFIKSKRKLARTLGIDIKPHDTLVKELKLGTLCPDYNNSEGIIRVDWKEWVLVGCRAIDGRYYYDIMSQAQADDYERKCNRFERGTVLWK